MQVRSQAGRHVSVCHVEIVQKGLGSLRAHIVQQDALGQIPILHSREAFRVYLKAGKHRRLIITWSEQWSIFSLSDSLRFWGWGAVLCIFLARFCSLDLCFQNPVGMDV